MATLRDIKNRIAGVTSIEKITSAMKMVSSIKSKRAQKLTESARPYTQTVTDLLQLLVSLDNSLLAEHIFLKPRVEVKNVLIIVVAGDKGMCGSFNSNLIKSVDAYLNTEFIENYPEATPHIITIGTKPTEYYKKRKYNIIGAFPNAFQKIDFSIVKKSKELFLTDYDIGNIDRVEIFYSHFVNLMRQEPTKLQVLPIKFDLEYNNDRIKNIYNYHYILDSDKKIIFETLINQYLDISIWRPILESNAAENSARLLAMDKATQNARDLIKELELQYNNARQSAITTEMLEIVGGAEALSKG
ncbi:MAG: ATP synthase F1 subunit gamma [Bacteroidetes bacterium]|nr:ATP synthase F1 subunit gamma [Bacteroidota bacterium]